MASKSTFFNHGINSLRLEQPHNILKCQWPQCHDLTRKSSSSQLLSCPGPEIFLTSLTNPKKPKSYKKSQNSPKPTMPRVSPRMRAHPEAASFSCSGPVIFLPSLTMLASQKVRRYKLRMRHSVESATSSTPYPGTLQTAMPSSPAAWKNGRKKNR